MPIAMVQASGTRSYFHTNRQGSTISMSGDNGQISEGPYRYDAYGDGAPATGVPFKYTGRRLDPETGLYYYRARYYSAALGKFLQVDPIGYADQMNLYGYVDNDPGNRLDPTGRATLEIIGTFSKVTPNGTITVTVGIGADHHGNWAITITIGGGREKGIPPRGPTSGESTSVSVGIQGSDGDTMDDLGGPFASIGFTASRKGRAVRAEGFTGIGTKGQPVVGGNVSVGVGEGDSFSTSGTFTIVLPLTAENLALVAELINSSGDAVPVAIAVLKDRFMGSGQSGTRGSPGSRGVKMMSSSRNASNWSIDGEDITGERCTGRKSCND